MSLRINQNLSALNARRYLAATDNALAKSIERLSSGFRINRASDDPAGLVISENLRAQIMGLSQAISNATDAVNMIKTAEAALDEVATQLKSMRVLAQHASNVGVIDAVSAAADQAQIRSSLESLDRIAATTQFGTKMLLDGSNGVTGNSTNAEVVVVGGTAATKAGTYSVTITQAATQGKVVANDGVQVQRVTGGADTGVNGLAATDYGILRFAFAAEHAGIGGSGLTVDIRVYGNDTIQDVIDRVNSDAVTSRYVKAGLDDTGKKLVFTTKYMDVTNGALTVSSENGSAAGTGGTLATFLGVAEAGVASSAALGDSSALIDSDETLTLRDAVLGGTGVTVGVKAGDSLAVIASKVNSAAAAAGIGVRLDIDDGGKLRWTSLAYGDGTVSKVTVTTTRGAGSAGRDNLGIDATDADSGITLNGAGTGTNALYTATDGVNVEGDINGETATGKGQILTGNAGQANVQGLQLKVLLKTAPSGPAAQVTVTQGSSIFQIGANAGQTATVSISSTATDKLGTSATGLVTTAKSLRDIDVTTFDGAQDAIRIIDAAIEQISSQRASLGAFQKNSLESTINSLTIARENLSATENAIRDADVAEESTVFTRNNILLQAGTAMLAQANQSSQAILQLLRG